MIELSRQRAACRWQRTAGSKNYASTKMMMIWLDFSLSCGYIDTQDHTEISEEYEQIGKMLGSMITAPEKFCYANKKIQA